MTSFIALFNFEAVLDTTQLQVFSGDRLRLLFAVQAVSQLIQPTLESSSKTPVDFRTLSARSIGPSICFLNIILHKAA